MPDHATESVMRKGRFAPPIEIEQTRNTDGDDA